MSTETNHNTVLSFLKGPGKPRCTTKTWSLFFSFRCALCKLNANLRKTQLLQTLSKELEKHYREKTRARYQIKNNHCCRSCLMRAVISRAAANVTTLQPGFRSFGPIFSLRKSSHNLEKNNIFFFLKKEIIFKVMKMINP